MPIRILRLWCCCVFAALPAAAVATPDEPAELDLPALAALEETWQQQRNDLNAYHIVKRTRHPRHGDDAPWRHDTFIRLNNALHHTFYTEPRPTKPGPGAAHTPDAPPNTTESVTIVEPDGRVLNLSLRGITQRTELDAGIEGRGLGRVFLQGADRVTVLARPPESQTWEFILHKGDATDEYIVHAATGAVLQREARDADGRTTSIVTRTPQPLDVAAADAGIRSLMERAESQQVAVIKAETSELAVSRSVLWATCGFVLVFLGAASRGLCRGMTGRRRLLWVPLTAVLAGLVAASYWFLEYGIFPWYSMLLAVLSDIPITLFGLPQTLNVHIVAAVLVHSLIFGSLWVVITWIVLRAARLVRRCIAGRDGPEAHSGTLPQPRPSLSLPGSAGQ